MAMDHGESQKRTSPAKTVKPYLLSQISKLAAAVNVELTKETIAVYAEVLATLSREVLESAVRRTIWEWDRPHMMPPVAFLLERAVRETQELKLLADTNEILHRPDKPEAKSPEASIADIDPAKCPKGWTVQDVQRSRLTMATIRAQARKSVSPREPGDEPDERTTKVTPAEIAEWFERGQQAQREKIAGIIQTREYQQAAALSGVPGYTAHAEQLAAERNGGSTIPADPADRAPWARKKAREQGWITAPREPGDE